MQSIIYNSNIHDDVKQDLIDIYGGALTTISVITDKILDQSGTMRQLLKDKRSILFESFKGITGILISDYNSIELRRKFKTKDSLNYIRKRFINDSDIPLL